MNGGWGGIKKASNLGSFGVGTNPTPLTLLRRAQANKCS